MTCRYNRSQCINHCCTTQVVWNVLFIMSTVVIVVVVFNHRMVPLNAFSVVQQQLSNANNCMKREITTSTTHFLSMIKSKIQQQQQRIPHVTTTTTTSARNFYSCDYRNDNNRIGYQTNQQPTRRVTTTAAQPNLLLYQQRQSTIEMGDEDEDDEDFDEGIVYDFPLVVQSRLEDDDDDDDNEDSKRIILPPPKRRATVSERLNRIRKQQQTQKQQKQQQSRGTIGIGIDLGTTNSAVAYISDDDDDNDSVFQLPRIIPIPHHGPTMPSVVALLPMETTNRQQNSNHDNNNNNNNNNENQYYKVLVGNEAIQYEKEQLQQMQEQKMQPPQQGELKATTTSTFPKNTDTTTITTTTTTTTTTSITTNHTKNHNHHHFHSLNVYRNVKRIIGTGGNIQRQEDYHSDSSKTIYHVVPNIMINKQGQTYPTTSNLTTSSSSSSTIKKTKKKQKKITLSNVLNDAEHYPTLLRYTPTLRNNTTTTYGTLQMENQVPHDEQLIRPELVSSYIIQHLRSVAETYTNCTVTRAVIGVPAYFNDAQRQATIMAAQLAGISKVKLLREPEAAAYVYSRTTTTTTAASTNNNNNNNEQTNQFHSKRTLSDTDDDEEEVYDMDVHDEFVLVFDLGGGTYDVSMLLMGGGVTEVLSTSGNVQLGGNVFDTKIASYLTEMIRQGQQQQQQQLQIETKEKQQGVGNTRMNTKEQREQQTQYADSENRSHPNRNNKQRKGVLPVSKWSETNQQMILSVAEQIRVYLSNNRQVLLALPLQPDDWTNVTCSGSYSDRTPVIVQQEDFDFVRSMNVNNRIMKLDQFATREQKQSTNKFTSNSDEIYHNGTHLLFQWTRRDMEVLCYNEFNALVRPIREVAIMSGALLPGDTSPAIVEAIQQQQQQQQETTLSAENLYSDNLETNDRNDEDRFTGTESNVLKSSLDRIELEYIKRDQQKGRKRARTLAKDERKYRAEKQKAAAIGLPNSSTRKNQGQAQILQQQQQQQQGNDSNNSDKTLQNTKVRDGITGKPIGKIILVGGASRMPTIHRMLTSLTGIVPQICSHNVNPDEAVAIGCAIQIYNLDGRNFRNNNNNNKATGKNAANNNNYNNNSNNVILNPMQAAIVRALALQQEKEYKKLKEQM